YDYKLFQTSIAQTDSVKDLGVFIDAKLYFHDKVNYIFFQCAKLLGLVHNITFNFSSLDCMFGLYTTLVRSKLEYASVVWNSITSTDANKLDRIQQRFAALCFKRFFPQVHYNYSLALEELKLHTLCTRRHCLDALFLIQVYFGSKFCPSLLEIVGLEFLLCISEILHCSMFAPYLKIVLLLDAQQLLMLSAGMLTYSEPRMFYLNKF
ncbi:hypothetical protein B7P43_G08774, partial [Cryptotermes secundus]